jgi:exodeoxyribonuclease VII small subunit
MTEPPEMTEPPKTTEPLEQLSYEQARAELAAVVDRLEAGAATLEESLTLWERGEHLADVCQGWLDGAQHRLEEGRTARTDPAAADPDSAS